MGLNLSNLHWREKWLHSHFPRQHRHSSAWLLSVGHAQNPTMGFSFCTQSTKNVWSFPCNDWQYWRQDRKNTRCTLHVACIAQFLPNDPRQGSCFLKLRSASLHSGPYVHTVPGRCSVAGFSQWGKQVTVIFSSFDTDRALLNTSFKILTYSRLRSIFH